MAQSRNSPSNAKCSFLRSAALVLTAGVLLGGCDKRHDAQVTPTPSTPRPKTSVPAKMVQKPQTELAQMFTAAGTVLLSLKTPEELERIQPFRDVTLSRQLNGLKITSTGPDPSVLIPDFSNKNPIVKIVIESPAITTLQLFYRLPRQRGYKEAQSLIQQIAAGRNVVYAELPDPAWTGRLRLDPGDVRGDYILESIEVKAVAPARAP